MVTDAYLHVHHHPTPQSLVSWAQGQGLPLFGVDNLPGSVPITEAEIPRRCILVFGQEGPGLSEEVRAVVETVLSIPQFGSTRSINAGVASGIAMYEWCRRHV